MGFLHYTHAMLQNCLREDMYGQRFLTVWGQVSFKKETECSGSSGNLLSFTIVTMLSGTVASGVSFCLSTFVSCFLFAFCKLAANGLPVGFAEGTCCFCMVSKAATCALRLGRSQRSLTSDNIAFIPRLRWSLCWETVFCSNEDFHDPAQTWQLQMNDYESRACMWHGHGGD